RNGLFRSKQYRHRESAAQRLQNLVRDVHPRADGDGVLNDQVVALLFGNALDGLVSLLDDGGELLVATAVEVFLELATLALQIGVEIGELTLALDTLGFRHDGSVLVELLGLAAQIVRHALEFVVTLLELGLDLGLSS